MRRKREIHIEEQCCRYAELQRWEHVKLDRAKRGWPDRLFFGPDGRSLMVEFKRPGEKLRPQQRATHRRLFGLGHPVIVVDSVAVFCALLDRTEPKQDCHEAE
jgi:hypothetical protein